MRIISLLIFLIISMFIYMEFIDKVNKSDLRQGKTFEQQKRETLQQFNETKILLDRYKKERAKGVNR